MKTQLQSNWPFAFTIGKRIYPDGWGARWWWQKICFVFVQKWQHTAVYLPRGFGKVHFYSFNDTLFTCFKFLSPLTSVKTSMPVCSPVTYTYPIYYVGDRPTIEWDDVFLGIGRGITFVLAAFSVSCNHKYRITWKQEHYSQTFFLHIQINIFNIPFIRDTLSFRPGYVMSLFPFDIWYLQHWREPYRKMFVLVWGFFFYFFRYWSCIHIYVHESSWLHSTFSWLCSF